MAIRDVAASNIIRRTILATSAQLAAYYQGDSDKEAFAGDEIERLAALDFSAMSTGREIVNKMILNGHATVVEVHRKLLPFDMIGLTNGATRENATNALSQNWCKVLSLHMSDDLTLAERCSLVNDLWTALVGYSAELRQANARSRSWWRSLVRRICPQSLTVGINVLFLQLAGNWRIPRDRP